jgi:S-DNA-T family DNA segregation ATPase FtsK/SpoIIIE
VLETKRGSVSLLQRRLAIGYTRASRLIDLMGIAGIIGEHKGSVAREVLISPEEWDAIKQMAEEMAAQQGMEYPREDHPGGGPQAEGDGEDPDQQHLFGEDEVAEADIELEVKPAESEGDDDGTVDEEADEIDAEAEDDEEWEWVEEEVDAEEDEDEEGDVEDEEDDEEDEEDEEFDEEGFEDEDEEDEDEEDEEEEWDEAAEEEAAEEPPFKPT